MVSSLQKDLTARERQALNLAAEVDKLRQNVRHKDAKLTDMMDKVSIVFHPPSIDQSLQYITFII